MELSALTREVDNASIDMQMHRQIAILFLNIMINLISFCCYTLCCDFVIKLVLCAHSVHRECKQNED